MGQGEPNTTQKNCCPAVQGGSTAALCHTHHGAAAQSPAEPGAAPTPRYGTAPRASWGHGRAAAQPRGPAGCGGCSVPGLAVAPRRGAARAGLIPAPPGNESGPVSVRARAGSKGVRKPPQQPFPCTSKRPPRALPVSLPRIRWLGQDQSRWVLARERHRPHAARGCCSGVALLLSGCFAPCFVTALWRGRRHVSPP